MRKKIITASLTCDAGCHIAILGLHERLLEVLEEADVGFSYLLIDSKTIPEDVDMALVEGGVSTERDLELLKEIRSRSKQVVAMGSCACFGGIPSLTNLDDRKSLLKDVYMNMAANAESTIPNKDVPSVLKFVQPLSEVIQVDYQIPGCPVEEEEVLEAIKALLEGRRPEVSKTNVCDECPKERRGVLPKEPKRAIGAPPDPEICLLEQGYLCLGPVTRAGCEARCPKMGILCDGCRGPAEMCWDQGMAMLDALTALLYDKIGEYHLKTHSATFYRHTFGSSLLQRLLKKR